jgi:hypothetical protein
MVFEVLELESMDITPYCSARKIDITEKFQTEYKKRDHKGRKEMMISTFVQEISHHGNLNVECNREKERERAGNRKKNK